MLILLIIIALIRVEGANYWKELTESKPADLFSFEGLRAAVHQTSGENLMIEDNTHLPGSEVAELHHSQGVVGAMTSFIKLDVTRQTLQTDLQVQSSDSSTTSARLLTTEER